MSFLFFLFFFIRFLYNNKKLSHAVRWKSLEVVVKQKLCIPECLQTACYYLMQFKMSQLKSFKQIACSASLQHFIHSTAWGKHTDTNALTNFCRFSTRIPLPILVYLKCEQNGHRQVQCNCEFPLNDKNVLCGAFKNVTFNINRICIKHVKVVFAFEHLAPRTCVGFSCQYGFLKNSKERHKLCFN